MKYIAMCDFTNSLGNVKKGDKLAGSKAADLCYEHGYLKLIEHKTKVIKNKPNNSLKKKGKRKSKK